MAAHQLALTHLGHVRDASTSVYLAPADGAILVAPHAQTPECAVAHIS